MAGDGRDHWPERREKPLEGRDADSRTGHRRGPAFHARVSSGEPLPVLLVRGRPARRAPPSGQRRPHRPALVVCHGDSCAPNTLLTDDGRWSAHVDLGALGTADRWADLAIATWNVTLNYGTGWENLLLDAYGVALDAERSRYYRLLGRCY